MYIPQDMYIYLCYTYASSPLRCPGENYKQAQVCLLTTEDANPYFKKTWR